MSQKDDFVTTFISPWDATKPYNSLPILPPKQELETKLVLKACVAARAALGELKQAAKLIPNQSMLINTIPLLEAKDSSEIENIVTTTDQLFQHSEGESFDGLSADAATKEALRYRTALKQGFDSLQTRPLCTATAVEVCRTIKNVEMDIRKTPGTQLKREPSGEVVYTPPRRRFSGAEAACKLGAVSSHRKHARPIGAHVGWALSIRGHTPVFRWKWAHRANSQYSVSDTDGAH
jgi:hypothetical protein